MNKTNLLILLVSAIMILQSGCNNTSQKQDTGKHKILSKSEHIKWVKAGTLVSIGPDLEPTERTRRIESVILSDNTFSRTRVETTEGIYIIGDKVDLVEIGAPVSVGHIESDEQSNKPSHLSIGGKQYRIVQ
jgi:hypothetical protein